MSPGTTQPESPTGDEIRAWERIAEAVLRDRTTTRAALALLASDPLTGEWLAHHAPDALRRANETLADDREAA